MADNFGYYGYEDLPGGRLYTSGGEVPGFLSTLLGYLPESIPGAFGYERLPEETFRSRHLGTLLEEYLAGGGRFPVTRGDIRDIPGGLTPNMVAPTVETFRSAAREYPFYPPYMESLRRALGE